MSSKIDGVPRDLLERLQSQTELSNDWDEVQALLAAPVVERQPMTDNTFIRGSKVGTKYFGIRTEAVEWIRTGQAAAYGEDTKLMPLYFENHSPELAELQATIAQQAAEIERLRTRVRLAGVSAEMTVHQKVGRAATDALLIMHERDQLKAEIERLKGGHGEPVAWITAKSLEALTPSGMVYVTGFNPSASMPLYLSSQCHDDAELENADLKKRLGSLSSALDKRNNLFKKLLRQQGNAVGYRCRFYKEPENWMVNWGEPIPEEIQRNPNAEYQALYTSQPAPVLVLPERINSHFHDDPIAEGQAYGWNACLDKVKELNHG